MERFSIKEELSSIIVEVSPEQLRDLANKLEAKANVSSKGTTIITPISNSVSFLYNVPIAIKAVEKSYRDSESVNERIFQ